MAETFAATRDVAVLADLLLLPTGRYPDVAHHPRRRKEEIFEALRRQFTGLAKTKPVLMTFEDLHWIDPTTLELLDLFIRRIEHLPVLLIATFRPEFTAPWADQPYVTVLSLNRLSRANSEALVRQLAAKTVSLPSDLVGEIVERGDGVPLFLEEVTKTVVDAEPLQQSESGAPRPPLSVPPTLHASLLARLDRIGPIARKLHRSGRRSAESFLTNSRQLSPGDPSRCSTILSAAWLKPASFSSAAKRRGQAFCLSMGCCGMLPIAHCSAARAGLYMRALRRQSRKFFQK